MLFLLRDPSGWRPSSRRGGALMSLAVVLACCAWAAPAQALHPAGQWHCTAPVALERLRPSPRETEAKLSKGVPVTVVAIGSSSTQGVGASSPSASYPAQLQAVLRQHCPNCAVTVINKGVGGETVDQTLGRFDRDVLAYRPNLVIWQVGSNDILQGDDMDAYFAAVTEGINRLRAAGIEVVLMDMQFAPSLLSHPQVTIMESRLAKLARVQGVSLFRRFDIMEHWIVGGQFRFADMLSHDSLHMTDASYNCLARLLGGALLHEAEDRTR